MVLRVDVDLDDYDNLLPSFVLTGSMPLGKGSTSMPSLVYIDYPDTASPQAIRILAEAFMHQESSSLSFSKTPSPLIGPSYLTALQQSPSSYYPASQTSFMDLEDSRI